MEKAKLSLKDELIPREEQVLQIKNWETEDMGLQETKKGVLDSQFEPWSVRRAMKVLLTPVSLEILNQHQ